MNGTRCPNVSPENGTSCPNNCTHRGTSCPNACLVMERDARTQADEMPERRRRPRDEMPEAVSSEGNEMPEQNRHAEPRPVRASRSIRIRTRTRHARAWTRSTSVWDELPEYASIRATRPKRTLRKGNVRRIDVTTLGARPDRTAGATLLRSTRQTRTAHPESRACRAG